MRLPVNAIAENPRAQVRAQTDQRVVRDYAEAMQNGAIFPPIIVFQEKGCQTFVVADGHHRLQAAIEAGEADIEVDLREGDETDALEFALGCNTEHGLRLNHRDRKHAVAQLMGNPKLADKYRTHQDRANLLRISLRQFQYLLAEWREKNPSSKTEAKAQEKAKESAEKFTAKTHQQDSDEEELPPEVLDTIKRQKSSPFDRQQQANLRELNNALETLAGFVYSGSDAVNMFGTDHITPKARAAFEFVEEMRGAYES